MSALNLPVKYGYESWRRDVLHKFRKSSGFLVQIPKTICIVEQEQMISGDIPYFWTDAGECGIFWSGGGVNDTSINYPCKDLLNELIDISSK